MAPTTRPLEFDDFVQNAPLSLVVKPVLHVPADVPPQPVVLAEQARHSFPLPIPTEYVFVGQIVHPLVPAAAVPEYPGAQTEQADASTPVVSAVGVL